jgi:elongator complex protein 3
LIYFPKMCNTKNPKYVNIILQTLKKKITNERDLRELKIVAAGHSGCLPKNSELLTAYSKLLKTKKIPRNLTLEKLLKKASVRTLSGVAPVAVLTKSIGCPGQCVFCPTEKNIPKSYLSSEPAVLRAMRAKFDPYKQVRTRLTALQACGHSVEKIELIIMGGTFSAHTKNYQNWFIRHCLIALNSHHLNEELTLDSQISENLEGLTLENLKKINENVLHRLVGLTLETRPDFLSEKEIQSFLRLGCTRVEIGLQSIYDEILKKVKRGHDVATTIRAIKLLKKAGLKVGLHVMPNLPGATPESDLKMFQEIFTNPNFCPDQLKIYPTVLTRGTELEKMWREKKWQPYSDETLTDLLIKVKKIVPKWVRLSRVIRDIPANEILAGSKITNLRQILQKQNAKCKCIRCREIREEKFSADQVCLTQQEYFVNGGKEIFLSFNVLKLDKLVALLRLFLPKNSNVAFVRELHSYGVALPIAMRGESGQHRGFGKKLIQVAEKITVEAGFEKLKIMAGVGVRDYYRKLEYCLDEAGIYMEKILWKKT